MNLQASPGLIPGRPVGQLRAGKPEEKAGHSRCVAVRQTSASRSLVKWTRDIAIASTFPPSACFWQSCATSMQTIDQAHIIGRHAMDDLRQHSREEYPDECCGVVVRDARGVTRAIRIRNIQDEMHAKDPARYPRTARTAYAGHPHDLRLALEAADEPGCALVAFYHSHPDHDSYFSAEDVAQATPFGEPSYPDALQLVVSVYDRQIRVIKAFAWSEAEGTFVEAPFEEAGVETPADRSSIEPRMDAISIESRVDEARVDPLPQDASPGETPPGTGKS
jgi:[CysO sulfur-carrier protein]-S-L-cysteine hydrolase